MQYATRLIQDTGAMYKESNIWRRGCLFKTQNFGTGLYTQTVF